ncbi:MAG TPA: PAS domain S-box protein [Anaerolineae bacterium]|nr:PAS domain S-box protein [Anaerolineae bacterium]MCB9108883.1 PAS domain S-box protein [Anaerolineales bacterium]HRV92572.1 PAS domain S-box protein [Anaerolineae bacterium]
MNSSKSSTVVKRQLETALRLLETGNLDNLHSLLQKMHRAEETRLAYYATVESECQYYRQMFEFAPDGYLVTDVAGIVKDANPAAETILNQSLDFLKDKFIESFVSNEVRPSFHDYLHYLADSRVASYEDLETLIEPHGLPAVPVTLAVTRLRDKHQRVIGFGWLLQKARSHKFVEPSEPDSRNSVEQQITAHTAELSQTNHQLRQEIERRIKMETELQESEARYRAIIEDNSELICRLKPDGTLTFVNTAFCRYFGKRPEELIGRSFFPIVPKEDRQRLEQYLAALSVEQPSGSIEHRVVLPNGEIHWQRWSDRLIFDQNGCLVEIQSVGRDITDRKQVELALTEERRLLRTLIDSLPDSIYFKDTQSRFIIGNQAVARLMGAYSGEELVGKTDFDFFPKDLAAIYYADEQAVVQSGQPLVGKEEPVINALGERRWLSTTKLPLLDQSGRVTGLVGIGRDITQHRELEEALYQKTAELEAIFRTIPDAVVFANTSRQIMKINPAFTTLFGYDIVDVFSRKTQLIYTSQEDYELQGQLRFNAKADEILEPYEVTYRRKNGDVFISETVGALVKDHEGRLLGFLSIIRDISERKKTELEKAQLFEAVSQQREQLRALTGRLAEAQEAERKALARELHDQVGQNLTALDLNLNIIFGRINSTSFKEKNTVQARLHDSLELIEQTAERIRDLMVNLRPPVLDDYGLLAALRWYGEQFASRVDFRVEVQGQEPVPRLSGSLEDTLFRITQEALTNVAKHAQANQVVIKIETDNEFVRLQIADDGSGFDLGQWVGGSKRKNWGLVTMIERAEAIGGYCQIESQPGQGTQVTVELPRTSLPIHGVEPIF